MVPLAEFHGHLIADCRRVESPFGDDQALAYAWGETSRLESRPLKKRERRRFTLSRALEDTSLLLGMGATPMAIRAPDIAFGDFVLNSPKRIPRTRGVTDVERLSVTCR